jgi:hypothetical protein
MWDYVAGEKYEPWMWFAHAACDCNGTGWVCQYCGGSRWVKQGEFGAAIPCPACCEIQDSGSGKTVVREKWWLDFVRIYSKPRVNTTPRRDRAAEYADQAERRDARRAFRASIREELQGEDDPFEEQVKTG